jgi:hypothetical protein
MRRRERDFSRRCAIALRRRKSASHEGRGDGDHEQRGRGSRNSSSYEDLFSGCYGGGGRRVRGVSGIGLRAVGIVGLVSFQTGESKMISVVPTRFSSAIMVWTERRSWLAM